MDNVISKISEIEAAAVLVMDEALDKKKQLSQDMDEKIAAFDKKAAEDTEKTLIELQASMEEDRHTEIEKLLLNRDNLLKELETRYEQKHSIYSQQIFDYLLKK